MHALTALENMDLLDRHSAEAIALKALGWSGADARRQAALFESVVAAVLEGIRTERERAAAWLEQETHGVISRGTASSLADGVRQQP